jgi:hypothetical protein
MPVSIPSKGADMKKITIPSFRQKKKDTRKVTMITVYDYVFTRDARSAAYPVKEENYSGGPEIDKHFPLP